ncbi:SH3 domain-containing protein [Loktanella sp. M215]|uniref:SH3 domain-containing protein n=1 Tax=Loktanella sp. M215 TaxID=2675431 RepID=UPI001F2D5022|nr:SH3 domain-containing protein [Loktanella sp. M215]MCF7698170.1 SH3 domain-containing protein [Loktanella sp. M215]
MGKFIIGTFGILAWTFYVLSGGASFTPETRVAAAVPAQPVAEQTPPADVVALITPVAPETVEPAQAPVDVDPVTMTPPPAIESAQDTTPIAVSATTSSAFAGSDTNVIGIAPSFTSLSAPAPASPDMTALREVAGRAVNMREGPDTSYAVLDTLPQGTQTEVIESDGTGWVRVRVVGTGQMGWMAERLLTNG